MIHFLFGEDVYRIKEKARSVIEKAKSNLNVFDLREKEEEAISVLNSGMNQRSLFEAKKLLVFNNPFLSRRFVEEFSSKKEEIQSLNDRILLVEEGIPDKRDGLFKFLLKKAECQEFPVLTGAKLRQWIKSEFGKYGFEITDNQAESMASSDLYQLDNEIKKAACYYAGSKKLGDLSLFSVSKIETDVFKTIDAIAGKDKKKAIGLIHNHLLKGESPFYLFSMIIYQFRTLLLIKDSLEKGYSISGLHPFVLRKGEWLSEKFSLPELKKIYHKCFKADLDMKTGRATAEEAIERFVLEI